MKSNIIINQGSEGKCKWASVINALEIMGKISDPQKELDECPGGYGAFKEIEEYFKNKGYIKSLKYIHHYQVKIFLKRGIPVCGGVSGYKKESLKNPPYIMELEDRIGSHAFCFISYDPVTKLYKVENSWGNKHGDNGYFYIKESDLYDKRTKLTKPFICQ